MPCPGCYRYPGSSTHVVRNTRVTIGCRCMRVQRRCTLKTVLHKGCMRHADGIWSRHVATAHSRHHPPVTILPSSLPFAIPMLPWTAWVASCTYGCFAQSLSLPQDLNEINVSRLIAPTLLAELKHLRKGYLVLIGTPSLGVVMVACSPQVHHVYLHYDPAPSSLACPTAGPHEQLNRSSLLILRVHYRQSPLPSPEDRRCPPR